MFTKLDLVVTHSSKCMPVSLHWDFVTIYKIYDSLTSFSWLLAFQKDFVFLQFICVVDLIKILCMHLIFVFIRLFCLLFNSFTTISTAISFNFCFDNDYNFYYVQADHDTYF